MGAVIRFSLVARLTATTATSNVAHDDSSAIPAVRDRETPGVDGAPRTGAGRIRLIRGRCPLGPVTEDQPRRKTSGVSVPVELVAGGRCRVRGMVSALEVHSFLR